MSEQPRVIRHVWHDGKQYTAHADDVTCDRCPPPTREPIRLTDEEREPACPACGHALDSPDGCSECPAPTLTDEAEAAWLKWVYENADLFNTDRLSFLAGFRAARLAGLGDLHAKSPCNRSGVQIGEGPTLADATSDLESEIAALLGRTFTYSDPSIYVDYDVPGDTFRIGDVRFSTKALAAVLIAHMADARTPESEDTE